MRPRKARGRSVRTALEKNNKTVDDLASGALFPFDVAYTILVWADTREELSSKSAILKKAIHDMGSAKYYQTCAKGAARRIFSRRGQVGLVALTPTAISMRLRIIWRRCYL